ncbi:hypothetical protein MLD38_038357 [Melastoma candidum]|uniref:Uncharacterized protein n=1 Tax=Melastoma candidum TaxID=119954 RepID=A0ACB9KYN6_9MYRT|nr:hypothetical protein MLD38_038357 [Melastoma candidum]
MISTAPSPSLMQQLGPLLELVALAVVDSLAFLSSALCILPMSSEFVLGKGHDEAADWWSVGVLIFEIHSESHLFIGKNREKIQQKIVRDKIKLPSFLSRQGALFFERGKCLRFHLRAGNR